MLVDPAAECALMGGADSATECLMNQELHRALAELQFSAALSDASLKKLGELVQSCEFATGNVIFSEGDEHPRLYLISAGEVALEMCVPARGCTRILTLGPGELLGWSALFGEARMTATAIAQTSVHLLVASGQAVHALCEADHEFGYELMREIAAALSKRLVATRLQLLDLYDVSNGRQLSSAALE